MNEHLRRGLERQRRLEFYKAKFDEDRSITNEQLEAVLPAWKAECDRYIASIGLDEAAYVRSYEQTGLLADVDGAPLFSMQEG